MAINSTETEKGRSSFFPLHMIVALCVILVCQSFVIWTCKIIMHHKSPYNGVIMPFPVINISSFVMKASFPKLKTNNLKFGTLAVM